MNSEPYVPRSIIGIIITTWAVGILIGLGAGKAIWEEKKVPAPVVAASPEYILLEKINGTFQVLTNVELVDLMVYGIKWGEQATNSP